ncbi:MAG: tripartite tricarboxylate transporter permease [Bilophila sp.]
MLFLDSLLAALSPFTLLMNFMGVMLGMIVVALPGLGSVVAITICLPFTFGMTSVSAIALLLGVYCGSICGGINFRRAHQHARHAPVGGHGL